MLDELKTFVAVVDANGFTRAAKIINLSQPSVSLHIKRLEVFFNTTLIQRTDKSKDIVITGDGELVYRMSKQIIDMLDHTQKTISSRCPAEYHMKIGASLTIGNYLLPDIIGHFEKTFNNIKLEAVINTTSSICQMVTNNQLDIALIEGRDVNFKLKRTRFSADEMILVAHPDFGDPAKITLKDLQNQVWVTREEDSGTYENLQSFLENNRIVAKNTIVFNSNYAIKNAILKGLGIALISEYVVKDELRSGFLVRLPMNKRIVRPYSYILPENKVINPPLESFIKYLSQLDDPEA